MQILSTLENAVKRIFPYSLCVLIQPRASAPKICIILQFRITPGRIITGPIGTTDKLGKLEIQSGAIGKFRIRVEQKRMVPSVVPEFRKLNKS